MKRYIKLFSLLLCVIVTVCVNDNAQAATGKHPRPQINGAGGAAIQLHRQNGTKHGTVWNGHACECAYCFGMCLGVINDPGEDAGMNVIYQPLANGNVQFFILGPVDEDAATDPTFYVDQNVLLSNSDASQSMVVIAGQYPYSSQPGIVQYKGKNFQYTGTVIVSIANQ